ncbi:WW domain-containing oxidoreductase [Colletotrichum graminicola]|uniref:WW domain-containing oxidoreductase n=1 Tax=Colletotrichum graminicola (strain M1.001 / M2 / FGSC 10212) TaxID=645133 RepID=E3QNS5_COLGM|nr:WW domain-containing oxidoreductase [Colletotrichum graminicola M1.001]EFQ32432.1 WW domain-containing oxidoreductase [Colletotrichum graminicola M1.001]WDK14573.1 WW domain-containing oxidoreductase [Colletotrichum graminicola]
MPSKYDATATASGLVNDLASEIKVKVILTTGVSPGGLGANFVEAIAKASPSLLILAARSPAKAEKTADKIKAANPDVKTKVLELDLGSLAAVRQAAETVLSWDDVPFIDVLVNNAGIMAVDYKLTPDGHESHFATNHLAHFLFTNLIIDKVLAAGTPRIVNISSDGHRMSHIRWDDYNFRAETYNRWVAYGQSKTADMLFSLSLAEKLGKRGLLSFSLHPGVIGTNLANHIEWGSDFAGLTTMDRSLGNKEGWAEFKWKTPDEGSATHVYASFEPSLKDNNGAYLENSHIADPWVETVKPWGTSPVEAERLWKLSEKLVGQEFQY